MPITILSILYYHSFNVHKISVSYIYTYKWETKAQVYAASKYWVVLSPK